jgi:hypothetical protein
MATTAPPVQPGDVIHAALTNPIRPGDLIRADLTNAIVGLLADLDNRVAALEALAPPGAGVKIISYSPATPRVGDQMIITGEDFDFTTRAAVVRFNSTIVPAFDPSSIDSQLVFIVPDVPGLADTGTQVTMAVSNRSSTATRLVTLLPRPQVFVGNVNLAFVSASPAPLVAAQPAMVQFVATSDGAPAVTVALSASVSTGWTGVQIMDAASPPAVLASRQITIPPHGQTPFNVQVPIPAGIASGTAFTLTVQAAGGGAAASTLKQLTVGQSTPPPDPNVEVQFRGVDAGTLAGSTLTLAPSTTAEFTFDVALAAVGSYDFAVALQPTTSAWVTANSAPKTTPTFTVVQSDIGADGLAHHVVHVDVTAPTAANDQPQMSVSARTHGGTLVTDATYTLAVQHQ